MERHRVSRGVEPPNHFFFDVCPAALGDEDEAAGLAALEAFGGLAGPASDAECRRHLERSETCRLVYITNGSWTDVKEEMMRRL